MKIETIILRKINWMDSSIIAHALTDEFGLISIMTKGAYKRKENILPSFELFSITTFDLYQGKSMFHYNSIFESHTVDEFYTDTLSFIVTYYMSEIILKTLFEDYKIENIFSLTKRFIETVGSAKNKVILLSAWAIKYVSFMGYRPYITNVDNDLIICSEGILSLSESISGHYEKVSNEERNLIQQILYSSFEDVCNIDGGRLLTLRILYLVNTYIKLSFDLDKLNSYNGIIMYLNGDKTWF